MGEYNTHYPRIIGQEWVPIRDEDFSLSPVINAFERGYSFRLLQPRQVRDARFYVNTPPAAPSVLAFQSAVYVKGTEEATGPIMEVIIPVGNATVTAGSSTVLIINGDTIGLSATEALTFAGDSHYIQITPNTVITNSTLINLAFNVNPYMQLLTNKRILDVQFLYAGNTWLGNDFDPVGEWTDGTILTGLNLVSDISPPVGSVNYGSLLPGLPSPGGNAQIAMLSLGEVLDPAINANGVQPWRFIDLQRLVPFAANRYLLQIYHNFGNASGTVLSNLRLFYDYAALRIIFCEERRLMVAGSINRYLAGQNNESLNLGQNVATMRAIQTQTADPVLNAGDYTLTLSAPNIGNRLINTSNNPHVNYPFLNEIRELYSLSSMPGIEVDIPFPVEDHVGDQFTQQSTHLIPQVTLHASGGPLTEPHVYGRQAVAQVWGSNSATQEIQDGLAGGATSWPWVRYYARRWGDTTRPLLLDSPSIGGSSVQITPAEFDALDEILDGWKEVTLRFSVPPTMGAGTQPQWRWTASGEDAGSRWEVLGATAPALSGLPGSFLTLSPAQLSIATYGQPVSGSSINLGWIPQYAPFVTGTVDDQTSDAVLIFAQDMPTISNFAVAGADQALVGIGMDCGINPCCIPTAIRYNTLTWTAPSQVIDTDNFNRSVANGWGTSSSGTAWTNTGGLAADYSVNGAEGSISIGSSVGTPRFVTEGFSVADVDLRMNKMVLGGGITPATQNITMGLVGRFTNTTNYYEARLVLSTSNTVTLEIVKRVAGTPTSLAVSAVIPNVTASGTAFSIRFQIIGTMLRAKAWDRNGGFGVEPSAWLVTAFDASLAAPGAVGTRFNLEVGNTNTLPVTFAVDDWSATRLTFVDPDNFGYIELQRMDTIDTDWQTIMKATSSYVSGFKDYEARVGIQSSYRIREVDVLNFPGPWSSTLNITMASPGASGGCISNGHLLLFSTNEIQDGSSNLAYSSVWEGMVEEGFSFPESSFVQLQAMYNRDFFTAFRPSERGGEQFERTVLVQAAAISPPTLADFTSLRDMAWDNVSYICVRDEDGNRWFATVLVPTGRVRRDRRLYTAQVQIIEVTDTPSEVNP